MERTEQTHVLDRTWPSAASAPAIATPKAFVRRLAAYTRAWRDDGRGDDAFAGTEE